MIGAAPPPHVHAPRGRAEAWTEVGGGRECWGWAGAVGHPGVGGAGSPHLAGAPRGHLSVCRRRRIMKEGIISRLLGAVARQGLT